MSNIVSLLRLYTFPVVRIYKGYKMYSVNAYSNMSLYSGAAPESAWKTIDADHNGVWVHTHLYLYKNIWNVGI